MGGIVHFISVAHQFLNEHSCFSRVDELPQSKPRKLSIHVKSRNGGIPLAGESFLVFFGKVNSSQLSPVSYTIVSSCFDVSEALPEISHVFMVPQARRASMMSPGLVNGGLVPICHLVDYVHGQKHRICGLISLQT